MDLQSPTMATRDAAEALGMPPGLLRVGQILCLIVAALTGALVLAGLPFLFMRDRAVCSGSDCLSSQLSSSGARALGRLGLSLTVYSALTAALALVFTALLYGLASILVRRTSGHWMPLFTAFVLIALAASSTDCLPALVSISSTAKATIPLIYFIQGAVLVPFFCLFPDGHFVPRWTRWLSLGWVALSASVSLLPTLQTVDHLVALPIAFGMIVGVQVYRYRRVSGPVQRQQTKWVLLGVGLQMLVLLTLVSWRLLVPALDQPNSPGDGVANAIWLCAKLLGPLGIGFAIMRYRLWDVDFVVNRTLVYLALTASVVSIYVVVVGGLGALLRASNSLALSLLATGLIAVLVQPLRLRLQRGINRLMYGERDDPYTVLSRLGRRLEATLAPGAILPAIVETIAQALKLPYAAIALQEDGGFSVAAASGSPAGEPLWLPLVYGNDSVGRLVLASRTPGEGFNPADRRLLDDLARQAGVAVHAVRLTADLQRSRERLVTTREEERRRLRRDLHDGLGPALASMTLQSEAARDLLIGDPARSDALLADLTEQLQAATADIRRLVYELRPPALDELGLASAVRTQAARYDLGGVRISVEAPNCLPPLPAAVEVAAYRILQEALTNVMRHAAARTCCICLSLDEPAGVLNLEVRDDGRGLPSNRKAGVGLSSMRERAAELGGTCVIEPLNSGGTRVRAQLPCPVSSPSAPRLTFPPREEAGG